MLSVPFFPLADDGRANSETASGISQYSLQHHENLQVCLPVLCAGCLSAELGLPGWLIP